jgi:hypothetical protein
MYSSVNCKQLHFKQCLAASNYLAGQFHPSITIKRQFDKAAAFLNNGTLL